MEQCGVACRGIEFAGIVEEVMISLVTLNAFQPTLDLVHGGQHGGHIMIHSLEGTQCTAGTNNSFVLQLRQGRLAETTTNPQGVILALADIFHLETHNIHVQFSRNALQLSKERRESEKFS